MAEPGAVSAAWLEPARTRIAAVRTAGRLPHALLIVGPAGVGKAALADWIARLALCERPGANPCGVCRGCHLIDAGTHPDLVRLGIPAGKTQVPVEEVRALIEVLTLTSGRGGQKVGLVDPADAMNAASANALLKTLEEPTPGSLLLLTASRPERLPATVASRCQRLSVPRPPTAVALAWLNAIDTEIDWRSPLALAGGGPFRALGLKGAEALDREMSALPGQLARADIDLVALAERFEAQLPAERLRWIENWVTDRIVKALTAAAPGHTPSTPGLPPTARTRHIQALYAILDELRLAQALLRGPANVALLWERLLIGLSRELNLVRAGLARAARG